MRPEFNKVLSDANKQKELVFQFFTLFSRFEFALKEVGFRKLDQADNVIGVDWQAFARKLPVELTAEWQPDELKSAISYLFSAPPRRLKQEKDGSLRWYSKTSSTQDNNAVLTMVTTIRNNLFHGGKTPFEPGRDAKLLNSALIILSHLLDLDRNVYEAFGGGLMWIAA